MRLPGWRLALLVVCLLAPATLSAEDRVGPFKHAERSVRSRDFDQQHLRLDLDINWADHSFTGVARHTLTPFKPLDSLTFDAAEMEVRHAWLLAGDEKGQKKELNFEQRKEQLVVRLDRSHPAGESLTVAIEYLVKDPEHGVHFVFPDQDEPDGQTMLWTQSEPEYARYWFPCFDSPTDRLTSEIFVKAPVEYLVLSNGRLLDTPAPVDGVKTWHWSQAKSHVPYLMSIVVGDFEKYEQRWRDTPITSYTPRGRLADAERSFADTPAMMEFFSRKIGVAYPWPKYAQICVDEYKWGGMEHTSATTLNLSTLHDAQAALDVSSENLVAHELAHQWYGDLLTCKDWGELWLNESFATFFATLWKEQDEGPEEAAWERFREEQSYLAEDKTYRRSIVNYRYDTPIKMFDRHSYPKGARVLQMLRFELGEDLFWKSIQHYTAANQHRTVETADLRRAIEDASGQGLNWFFDQWIYHGGHPEFHVDWRWDADAGQVRVHIEQKQKVDDVTPLFRTHLEIEVAVAGKEQLHRVLIEKADQTFDFPAAERPTRVCLDPSNWVLKELTADKSKQEWLDQLQHDSHLVCRAQAAEGLAEFVKDTDVVAALAQAAQQDPFWGVREEATKALANARGDAARKALLQVLKEDQKSTVRQQAIASLEKYAHDDTRAALRAAIADDASYKTVSSALEMLAKVDRAHCADDLLQALERPSHREQILKAACKGLAEIKHAAAVDRLADMLEHPLTFDRRLAIAQAIVKFKQKHDGATQRLRPLLASQRQDLRLAAVQALAETGDEKTVGPLTDLRAAEKADAVVKEIDKAIKKLNEAAKK
ncbi:Aminopeptidase N [Lignipirellula cremea]|uniref:Aminopeptidase N n=2 Tax=Lignipirellula cremea TaxID=2528010 RepID=A0A518E332_9BACT|nr:Aminopeptidase N [Lignipirellula cremea]